MTALIKYEAACRALAECKAFIAIARASFVPSSRKACKVCGRFESLTQAHHTIPLAIQFARGFETADQAHVWLCPTHHAAVHVLIGQAKSLRGEASRACINVVNDLSLDELRGVLEIADKAWA